MNTVTLPTICDRAAARALYPELLGAVGAAKVTVEAGSVERIGQAMLQLLVSASETESGISLHSPSEPLVNAIRLAGLEASLGAEISEAGAA